MLKEDLNVDICKHNSCFNLPMLEPAVLDKYPQKDYVDFPFPSLLADFCFPSGLKMCLCQNRLDENAEGAEERDFLFVLKNSDCVHFYISVLQFYETMTLSEFEERFDVRLLFDCTEDSLDIDFALRSPNPLEPVVPFVRALDLDATCFEEASRIASDPRVQEKFKSRYLIHVPKSISLLSRNKVHDSARQVLRSLLHAEQDAHKRSISVPKG